MEDAHYIEDCFNGNPNQAFFAVYDGHGGKECANFCAENLHKVLKAQLDTLDENKNYQRTTQRFRSSQKYVPPHRYQN
jgi:serine/threonine protein phosphatase PrpC